MLRRFFTIILASILFAAQTAQAMQAAMPESFKFLGRGVIDRKYRTVLMLVCTGGWNEQDPSTWANEPGCDQARFAVFSLNGDPRWVGPAITSANSAEIVKELKRDLSGQDDYSIHAIFSRRPNQEWLNDRNLGTGSRFSAIGAVFAIAVPGALMFLGAPSIVAIPGIYLGWQLHIAIMDLAFSGVHSLKKAAFGRMYSEAAHTMTLREVQSKKPENWSVRPVEIRSGSFRLVHNALTADDSGIQDLMPGSICRFSGVETTYVSETRFEEEDFFRTIGAYEWGGRYFWSFYDRAKNAPGCDPNLKGSKMCLHNVEFHSQTFFEQALRSSWIKTPDAPVARIAIERIPAWPHGHKYRAKLSLGEKNPITVTTPVKKNAIELMRALSKRIRDACSISARATP